MDEKSKPRSSPHWKGQSRVLKLCHWCAKKQDPNQKQFQACSRCKEVIYCSKECQVASWPLHKEPCKVSANSKNVAAANPAANAAAKFKKWHSLHLGPLRHAIICALDLGHHPAALDDNLLFIEIRLKVNHSDLPSKRQYEPVGGFTLTMTETREMLGITPVFLVYLPLPLIQISPGNLGGGPLLDSLKDANVHMKNKGGLGVAAVLLQTSDIIDMVKIVLPSPAVAKQVQEADNWGEEWLQHLRKALESD